MLFPYCGPRVHRADHWRRSEQYRGYGKPKQRGGCYHQQRQPANDLSLLRRSYTGLGQLNGGDDVGVNERLLG